MTLCIPSRLPICYNEQKYYIENINRKKINIYILIWSKFCVKLTYLEYQMYVTSKNICRPDKDILFSDPFPIALFS